MKINFKRAISAITAILMLQTSVFAADITFDKDTRTITLTGKAKTNDSISVLILKPGATLSADMTAEQIKNSILLPYEVTPDELGNYTVALIPPGDADGNCKVILTSEKEKINNLTVDVFSSTNLTSSLADLTTAAGQGTGAVSTLLEDEDTRKILGVDEIYSHEEYRNELYNLLASKNSYADYEEVEETVKVIEDKINLLISFNETINKAQIPELIEKLYTSAYTKDSYYTKYKGFKYTDTVDQAMYQGKPYTSLASVYTKFTQAVSNYNEGSSGSTGTGNSGNSYVSGGRYGTAFAPIVAPEVSSNEKFTDVGKNHWAFKYISELTDAGVVSGVSENSFEPERQIKREEFVKMIVSMLNKNGGVDNFVDSDKNSWYSPYLATASKIGLVLGREDGSFGVGETLTRQDMSVLIMRAAEIGGVEIKPATETGFIDESAISEYARPSVAALYKAGIINGMGNNCFAPKASATRAQAAKMIYELREMMEGTR